MVRVSLSVIATIDWINGTDDKTGRNGQRATGVNEQSHDVVWFDCSERKFSLSSLAFGPTWETLSLIQPPNRKEKVEMNWNEIRGDATTFIGTTNKQQNGVVFLTYLIDR